MVKIFTQTRTRILMKNNILKNKFSYLISDGKCCFRLYIFLKTVKYMVLHNTTELTDIWTVIKQCWCNGYVKGEEKYLKKKNINIAINHCFNVSF